MKLKFSWASAVALAVIVGSQISTLGVTNGIILIATRAPQDTAAGAEYYTDERGPGMTSPGDIAMASLLSDYGYSCRVVLDKILGDTAVSWPTTPVPRDTFLQTINPAYAPALFIISGSVSSADAPNPPITNGTPVMMGEHVTLGNRIDRAASVFMYENGGDSTDPNQATGASRYMKVVNPTHPIMQGIPLDAQGRVKIFRDPYPEENLHVPAGGKQNYEYRWCTQRVTNAAPGTAVLGVLDGEEFRSCFAVADVGGILASNNLLGYAETNQVRLVHMFVNEQGSGGPRRCFNALTDLGRVLFVRAAKWAMGETLQPYQGLGLIRVSKLDSQQFQLEWDATPNRLYKILGTRDIAGPGDLSNWQTVAQDIAATNGVASVKFEVSGAVQYTFLRVAPMP
jgi:hypothetical protein